MTGLRDKMDLLAEQIADELTADDVALNDRMDGLKILSEYWVKVIGRGRADDSQRRNGWDALRDSIGGSRNGETDEA